ncbi:hypothetical protein HDR61_03160 [bacterium]|nr:hypothetical protein [bacterium]
MISLLFASFVMATPPMPVADPDSLPTATPVYAGVAISDADADDVRPASGDTPVSTVQKKSSTPLLSINTDILDMNWASAMDFSDPALRVPVMTLPFMDGYNIDNIEVKLRLLNVTF